MATHTSDEVVLTANSLKKTFHIGFFRKKVPALLNSTFEVRRGEIFGLVGPNGAGKTTTIKVLMGLIRADGGDASIFGVDVRDPAARLRVGFLPETPSFYDYLKPGELLSYFAQLYGLEHRVAARRIPELLELVGLTQAASKPIRKFSKGMTQRIGIAQALLPDADLVLLDEPQSGLDPVGRKDVRDIITNLRDRGKTVVFSSHILNDVEQICDRIAIIVNGTVRRTGRIADMIDSTVRTIEITVRLSDDRAAAEVFGDALKVERLPDQAWRIDVSSEQECRTVLKAAIAAEATILGVERHRVRLEDVFMSETRAANASAEAAQ